ncbi:DUF3313 family protein [Escherichia coli]|uniref:DUF3313 family protein n=1 Tax=Escherichia coli TaxID=562 RepID=UPI002577D809|nr:DUF3313 family protein [Escherichia coli]
METQLIDAKTGQVMLEAVRKAYGKTVPNNSTPVTLEDLKEGVDQMINDIAAFPPQS